MIIIGIGAAVTRRPLPTPPCVRVRTRRFELVALGFIDQRRKAERLEVGVRKPRRGLWPERGTRDRVRCQPCCWRGGDEPRAPAELRGEGVVSAMAATEPLAIAIGPNGSGRSAPPAFRRNRSSYASPACTERVPL